MINLQLLQIVMYKKQYFVLMSRFSYTNLRKEERLIHFYWSGQKSCSAFKLYFIVCNIPHYRINCIMRHFCLGFSLSQTFVLEETMLVSVFQNRNVWPIKLFQQCPLQHSLHWLNFKPNQHLRISLHGAIWLK